MPPTCSWNDPSSPTSPLAAGDPALNVICAGVIDCAKTRHGFGDVRDDVPSNSTCPRTSAPGPVAIRRPLRSEPPTDTGTAADSVRFVPVSAGINCTFAT